MTEIERVTTPLAGRYAVQRELEQLRHEPDIAESISKDRFIREIAITARLNHPNILPLLDSGQAGGFLYYVMPLATGESLQDRLRREGALPIGDALRLACEVTEALAYAHSHGVVHRDIKPANVLLSEGHAIVADFGIATALKSMRDAATLTMDGTSHGTPIYMAPEQATGEGNVDNRADVYAVGVMLFEMTSGTAPFAGTWAQIMPVGSGRLPVAMFLPKHAKPPYQTVAIWPASDALIMPDTKQLPMWIVDFFVRSGRAVVYPVYEGILGRTTRTNDQSGPVADRDLFLRRIKEMRRAIDYASTRADLDSSRLVYVGASWGGRIGGVAVAVEPRFKAAILYVAALSSNTFRPEVDAVNFLPRIHVPVLMLSGKYDSVFPYELSQKPFYRLLGTPVANKKHLMFPC